MQPNYFLDSPLSPKKWIRFLSAKGKKKIKICLITLLDISLWQDSLFVNVAAGMNHYFQKYSFIFFLSWIRAKFWKRTKALIIKHNPLTTYARSPGNSLVTSAIQRAHINYKSVASSNYDSRRTLDHPIEESQSNDSTENNSGLYCITFHFHYVTQQI